MLNFPDFFKMSAFWGKRHQTHKTTMCVHISNCINRNVCKCVCNKDSSCTFTRIFKIVVSLRDDDPSDKPFIFQWSQPYSIKYLLLCHEHQLNPYNSQYWIGFALKGNLIIIQYLLLVNWRASDWFLQTVIWNRSPISKRHWGCLSVS